MESAVLRPRTYYVLASGDDPRQIQLAPLLLLLAGLIVRTTDIRRISVCWRQRELLADALNKAMGRAAVSHPSTRRISLFEFPAAPAVSSMTGSKAGRGGTWSRGTICTLGPTRLITGIPHCSGLPQPHRPWLRRLTGWPEVLAAGPLGLSSCQVRAAGSSLTRRAVMVRLLSCRHWQNIGVRLHASGFGAGPIVNDTLGEYPALAQAGRPTATNGT